jgi:hypothetical protein
LVGEAPTALRGSQVRVMRSQAGAEAKFGAEELGRSAVGDGKGETVADANPLIVDHLHRSGEVLRWKSAARMSGQSFLRFGVTQDTPDPFPDEERGVFEMGLCGPGDDVNVVEAVEAGAAVGD